MNELLTTVLTLVLNYGYPIIVAVILVGYLGIPISLNIVLVAAGAFATDGTLDMIVLIPLITLFAVLGDSFNYLVGKKFGYLVVNRYTRTIGLSEQKLDRLSGFLESWGRWLIFSSRFLFTPIGIPVNLIAGITRYSFKKFILFCFFGEFIWASIYLSIGYLFGSSWVGILDYINQTPQIILFLFVGISSLYLFFKIVRKHH